MLVLQTPMGDFPFGVFGASGSSSKGFGLFCLFVCFFFLLDLFLLLASCQQGRCNIKFLKFRSSMVLNLVSRGSSPL